MRHLSSLVLLPLLADTQPDPTRNAFNVSGAVACNPAISASILATFPSGASHVYPIATDRANVMGYWGCDVAELGFDVAQRLSGSQADRVRNLAPVTSSVSHAVLPLGTDDGAPTDAARPGDSGPPAVVVPRPKPRCRASHEPRHCAAR